MNIALLCALIIVTAKTDGFHVQNERTFHKELGQGIILRKLQSSLQDDPKETKTMPWNKILADALVSHIRISSDVETITKEKNENCIVNLMSQTMKFFKIFIYDRFVKPFESDIRDPAEVPDSGINKTINTVGNGVEPSVQSGFQEPTVVVLEVANTLPNEVSNFSHPKTEVEIIDSVYHGKLIEEDIGEAVATVSTCPDGLVAAEDGSCTKPKSKYILSIPFQCPYGYRRDWVGICRQRL